MQHNVYVTIVRGLEFTRIAFFRRSTKQVNEIIKDESYTIVEVKTIIPQDRVGVN